MKKLVIISIVLASIVLIILGSVLVLSQIKKDTFIVKMDIEGSNGYPPRLTILTDREVVEETQLLSMFSGMSVPSLSTRTYLTTISGVVTLICEGYNGEKNFNLGSNVYGEGMEQRIIFKGLPRGSDCVANAVASSCETDQAKCTGGNLYLRLQTPN